MTTPATSIETAIESALYLAIKANMDKSSETDPRIGLVRIRGLFIGNPDAAGNAGAKQDPAPANRIMIVCHPNIPQGFQGATGGTGSFSKSRDCQIDIFIITHPDDDPDRTIMVASYAAARKVFDDQEFDLSSDVVGLRGYLIENTHAGLTTDGFEITMTVKMKLFKK